jgi:hypothetical protein
VGEEEADGIGGHDGGDGQPFGPPQGLTEDQQADRAARTGLTLMKTPKEWAGNRRRVSRSARKGTAEESTLVVAA